MNSPGSRVEEVKLSILRSTGGMDETVKVYPRNMTPRGVEVYVKRREHQKLALQVAAALPGLLLTTLTLGSRNPVLIVLCLALAGAGVWAASSRETKPERVELLRREASMRAKFFDALATLRAGEIDSTTRAELDAAEARFVECFVEARWRDKDVYVAECAQLAAQTIVLAELAVERDRHMKAIEGRGAVPADLSRALNAAATDTEAAAEVRERFNV